MKRIICFIILLSAIFSFGYAQYPRDQKINAAEYFINTDPGEGNGIALYIGSPIPLWDITVDTNFLPSNLPVGSRIYIRFKSTNNTWSAPRCIKRYDYYICRGAHGVYGEVFLNTDPGQGNAIPAIFNYINGIAEFDTITIASLNVKRGDRIFYRIKDDYNRWSPAYVIKYYFKEINKAEYFLQSGNNISDASLMSLSPFNMYDCVFTGTANDVNCTNYDSVFVRYQTVDKFYSKWQKKILSDTNNSINENTKIIINIQNFPNPFSDITTIKFVLSDKEFVTLKVYNIVGNEVTTLINEEKQAGTYKVNFDASNLKNGVYFYKLRVRNNTSEGKMVFIR
ncbi:MAG: T9SS type A sorting domain-containing protein [Bacteroidia bacterium]|nr:T9SS type A sorting domain-containing protein [Bacteroidia bacterium]